MLPFINCTHESFECQDLHVCKIPWKLDLILFETAVSTTAKLNVPSSWEQIGEGKNAERSLCFC